MIVHLAYHCVVGTAIHVLDKRTSFLLSGVSPRSYVFQAGQNYSHHGYVYDAYMLEYIRVFKQKGAAKTRYRSRAYPPNDWLPYVDALLRHLEEAMKPKSPAHEFCLKHPFQRGGAI